ncbi:MAG: NTE family protein [Candidatus Azotimanducaceae bacterium]|jgi:NTE family protein
MPDDSHIDSTEVVNTGLDETINRFLESYFNLPVGDGQVIARDLETIHIHGDQPLFHQGDATDSMYLLIRGRLQVWIDADKPIFVGEVQPGESVGEVGLITGEPRSADVMATRHSVLVKLGRHAFEKLAADHPSMVMQLASIVARRLHENTTGINTKVRPAPSVICLRPLDGTARLLDLVKSIAQALEQHGSVLHLSEARVSEIEPSGQRTHLDVGSENFHRWFSQQEEDYGFVLLECGTDSNEWSRFAESQSDLIALLADADSDPTLRTFETSDHSDRTHMKHQVLILDHADMTINGTGLWLAQRDVDYHLHLRRDSGEDLARVCRIMGGKANGFVLGGGAARGFAHLGVYRALCESGIPVDWIGGTSIGAIMGVAIAVYGDADLVERNVREAFVEGKPFGDYTLPLVSILSGSRMNALSQKFMPGRIEDLAIPFFAISSDINTGDINIHESGMIWRATGASAALPGVLPPMVHHGSLAVDGAVLNNLPVDVMASKPVGQIFASMLSSRDEDQIDFEDIPSPWKLLVGRFFPSIANANIPSLAALLFKATEVANRKRTNELAARADVLFRPPVQDFSLLKVDRFDEIVNAGYSSALAQLKESKSADKQQ